MSSILFIGSIVVPVIPLSYKLCILELESCPEQEPSGNFAVSWIFAFEIFFL
jgi:hypothetical protein